MRSSFVTQRFRSSNVPFQPALSLFNFKGKLVDGKYSLDWFDIIGDISEDNDTNEVNESENPSGENDDCITEDESSDEENDDDEHE